MLWYGYIYYFLFLTTLFVMISYYLQIMSIFRFFKFESISLFFTYTISTFLFFFIISLTTLYYIFDYFASSISTNLPTGVDDFILNYYTYDFLIEASSLDLNLISVYYFPFIYIFLLITILSVIFCLNYNLAELTAFMFYCLIILLAGYLLFFTDSLILFFLSYELLLVPSFFILHNFAKTRRCVEAALLMFF